MDIDYHPTSDFHEFEKDEYYAILEQLADKKTGTHFVISHSTIKVANLTTRLWQKIKGVFGFEDKTNIVKVNYELLKFIRYGEQHHFFDEGQYTTIITQLKQKIEKVPDYNPVTTLLSNLINKKSESIETLLDKEIHVYYEHNQKELHKGFWHQFFHVHTPLSHINTALYQFNLGKIHLEEGRLEEALVALDCAHALNPEKTEYKQMLAQGFATMAQKAEAINDVKEALKNWKQANKYAPTNVSYSDALGKAYWKNDDIDHALTFLSDKSRLEIAQHYYEAGVEAETHNNVEEAFRQHMLALKFNPSHLESLKKLSLLQDKDTEGWITNLERIANLNPNDVQTHLQLGLAYMKKKDFSPAIDHLEKTVELDPKNWQAVYAIGQICQARNHFQQAIGFFLEAGKLQNEPFLYAQELKEMLSLWVNEVTHPDLLFFAGQLYASLHEEELALPLLRRSNTREAQTLLVQILEKQFSEAEKKQDLIRMEALAQEAYALQPDNTCVASMLEKAHRALGRMNLEQKDYSKALFHLNKALEVAQTEEDQSSILYLLGQTHVKLDENGPAIEAFTQSGRLKGNEQTYSQEIIPLYAKEGELYFRQLTSSPMPMRQAIIDFVHDVSKSDYYPAIVKSLGGWIKKENSEQNKEFLRQGIRAQTYDEIEREGKRALELLRTAYDGERHHMRNDEMPPALSKKMLKLESLLKDMALFHDPSQEQPDIPSLTDKTLQAYLGIYQLAPNEFDTHFNRFKDVLSFVHQQKTLQQKLLPHVQTINKILTPWLETLSSPRDFLFAGKLYLYFGEHDTALSLLQKSQVKEAYPLIIQLLKQKITEAENKQDFSKMFELAKEAYSIQPDDPTLIQLLEKASHLKLDQTQDPKEKLVYLEQAYTLTPSVENKQALAKHYFDLALEVQKSSPSIAIQHLEKACKLEPAQGKYHALLGRAYFAMEDYSKARLSLEQALRTTITSDNPSDLQHILGKTYFKLNMFDQAIEAFTEAGRLQGNKNQYLQEIRQALLANGDLSYRKLSSHPEHVRQAIIDLVHTISHSEYYPSIVNSLGWLKQSESPENKELLRQGIQAKTFNEVLKSGKRTLALVRKAYDGGFHHMRIDEMPRELSEKIQKLDSLLQDMSQFYDSKTSKGGLTSEGEKAVQSYLLLYEQDPDHYDSYINRLINTYYLQKEYGKAIQFYEKITSQHPTWPLIINPATFSEEAERLSSSKPDDERRVTLHQKAITLAPNNPTFKHRLSHTYYVLGTLSHQKGDLVKAKELYLKSLNCGVEAEASCYYALADLEETSYYEKKKNNRLSPSEKEEGFKKIMSWQKKAMELDPSNALYCFKHARFIFHEGEGYDYLPSIKKAVELEGDNAMYLSGLFQAYDRKVEEDKINKQFWHEQRAPIREKLDSVQSPLRLNSWQPGAPLF